ncbi:unnamed protein product [Allacma fusca]|uniref:G-protein coupled receptors family 2 profile 2 domain-containing protein n=1 Tax=Allacma fusca TaxID=39272 RepID=A0A8J2KAX8_9HEXA|nr:unnamed protein product [Allacma fusca]
MRIESTISLLENVLNKSAVVRIPPLWTKSKENRLNFKLQEGFQGCGNESFLVVLEELVVNASEVDNANVEGYMEFNGFLKLQNDFYRPSEYCLQEQKTGTIDGEQMDWKPPVFTENGVRDSDPGWQPHIRSNQLICKYSNGTVHKMYQSWPSVDFTDDDGYLAHKESIRLRKDGNLLFLGKKRAWEVIPPSEFCIDDLETYEEHSERPFMIVLCTVESDIHGRITWLYVTAMFTSAFFLFLTALVYGLLWDKHNVHGWTIFAYVTSMFFLYALLGASNVVGMRGEAEDYDPMQDRLICFIIGISGHLFFISTFCWLTLINFDLWSTFRSNKPVGERSKGLKRFLCYNLFAWGVSIAVVIVGVVLEWLYPETESEVVVPLYGQVNCFIAPWAKGYYVYSIIGLLMIINAIFIVLTSYTIYRFSETTRMVAHSRSGGAQQSFKLFSKLFVIMGVTWTFDIISWLFSQDTTIMYSVWIILDLLNICQAIAIFVIFICKQKTVEQLRQKFPIFSQSPDICGRAHQGKSSANRYRSTISSSKETSASTQNTSTKNSSVV